MAEADLADRPTDDGLIVLLPALAGQGWRWWPVEDGALGAEHGDDGGADRPWGELGAGARVVALAPAALAPVRTAERRAMPLPQALAAARLEATGAAEGWSSGALHVAVAAGSDEASLLVASVAPRDMDLWLAQLAEAGLVPDAIVPAALVLPAPERGVFTASLGGARLARTREAAFAGEPELVAALAPDGPPTALDGNDLATALLATWRAPPLDLRQGPYAPRRVSFFRLPDWVQLGRMAAVALLLGFLVLAVETVKLNADATARERAALAAAQQRFPAAVDLASAQTLAAGELARRGVGGGSFAAPASAVLAAMRPLPSLKLRDLAYGGDGTLRFQAAAPAAEDINRLLAQLQNEGWQITVPPQLAPDPTGATVAAITVRAP